MSQNPEVKSETIPTGPAEGNINEPQVEILKETPEVQETETGVVKTPTSTPAISDQTQKSLADDMAAPVVTITIPATAQQLQDWSKGSPEDSLTWVAYFWIRMIKKAIFYGWNVVTGGNAQLSV